MADAVYYIDLRLLEANFEKLSVIWILRHSKISTSLTGAFELNSNVAVNGWLFSAISLGIYC